MTKKRAWKDAKRDYVYTEASYKRARAAAGWRLFLALLLSGALYKLLGG